ncbi:DUF2871 domain-containing protein [Leucobacter rhizosphaerae]|uniref:DUF2871 domain-containing protein n=1 Tax=Leucobacter rhizosphaerae TaxID=2932245 RepID=A0ABY4FZ88_9MICO|nr:DUF2871 domain-containing protein [Leucobacter rhizosphaerae]UOQ61639.1 DUF2871 domain-containing protein [Leucobacter rhizosphaerae]
MQKPLTYLLVSAFAYAALGVASGLFYREFTKLNGFPEGAFTQLGLAHTHLLALGFLPFLILLGLERVFQFSLARKRFGWFLWLYHAGVILTSAMLIVHGSLTVLGLESSKMIAGLAGLGHMSITAAIVLLFFALRASLRRIDPSTGTALPAQVPTTEQPAATDRTARPAIH